MYSYHHHGAKNKLQLKITAVKLLIKALQSVTASYNQWFESYGQMQTTQVVASKKFIFVFKAFLQRWHPLKGERNT